MIELTIFEGIARLPRRFVITIDGDGRAWIRRENDTPGEADDSVPLMVGQQPIYTELVLHVEAKL